VLVDGYRRGYARGGKTTALLLPGYAQYEVTIRPYRSTFVTFDDSSRQVTLYPGSVVPLSWEVQSLYVVVGQLIDSDGKPIPYATLADRQGYAATDENGYFQAEVAAAGTEAELRFNLGEDGATCVVTAPLTTQRNGIVFVEPLACTPASKASPEPSDVPEGIQIGATMSVSSPE
jgi:outer membrane usher protein FimD/PapC